MSRKRKTIKNTNDRSINASSNLKCCIILLCWLIFSVLRTSETIEQVTDSIVTASAETVAALTTTKKSNNNNDTIVAVQQKLIEKEHSKTVGLMSLTPLPTTTGSSCQTIWGHKMQEALKSHKRYTKQLDNASFLVLNTVCFETNWPVYGRGPSPNIHHGPLSDCQTRGRDYCNDLQTAMQYLQDGQIMIIFDCRGAAELKHCVKQNDTNIVIPAVSWTYDTYRPGIDMGLPAPTHHFLYPQAIEKGICTKRKYEIVFRGKFKSHITRERIAKYHNVSNGIIIEDSGSSRGNLSTSHIYKELLLDGEFGLVIRGDVPFSYRLVEVMSAGAIPIIISDGWVLPYEEIIPWNSFSIRVNESSIDTLPSIVDQYTPEQRCTMRTELLSVVQRHFSSFEHMLETIALILENRQ